MAKVQKSTDSSSLAEVVDRILDKGIVIDAYVRVSLVGIDLVSVEARIVVASVETYLKYAEAIGMTGVASRPGGMGVIGSGTSNELDRMRAENAELRRRLEELS